MLYFAEFLFFISHGIKRVRGIGTRYSLRNNCGVFYTTERRPKSASAFARNANKTYRDPFSLLCGLRMQAHCIYCAGIRVREVYSYEAAYASIMHE